MKRNTLNYNKLDKNIRDVEVPCVGCGKKVIFRIKNEIVIEGEGVIAANIPVAVCSDCINVLVNRVADPLVCIKNLSPVLANEIIESFDFLLPHEMAVDFFRSVFPQE
jgi:hypothetical protein